jgi:hypothetical protein
MRSACSTGYGAAELWNPTADTGVPSGMLSIRHASILLMLPLAVAGGGCTGPLNNEPGIGNAGRTFGHSIYTPATLVEDLPAPQPEGLAPMVDQSAAPVYDVNGAVAPESAQPSIVSLDRDNWGASRVDVPNDFPAHQPRLSWDYIDKTSDPRAQGRYPDERTSLGTATTKHSNQQFVEAIVAPFVAAENVVMMIPRGIAEGRPQQPTRTGGQGYVRYPQQATIVNPAAESEGASARIDQSAAPRKPGPRKYSRPGAISVPADSPPTEELRPGGGMPASDTPNPAGTPGTP